MRLLDWAAILRGALTGVPVVVLATVTSELLVDEESSGPSAAVIPILLLVLLGFALSGFTAGRAVPAAPYSNAAVAAVVAVAMLQVAVLLARLVQDKDAPSIGVVARNFVLAYGAGLAGGLVAERKNAGRGQLRP